MRDDQREAALRELDADMKYFRLAAKRRDQGWRDGFLLRRVRQGMGIQVDEIVKALDVNRSVLGRLEKSEKRRTISLKNLDRVAGAMGCKVVYGIVSVSGEKMLEVSDRKRWEKRMRGKGEA